MSAVPDPAAAGPVAADERDALFSRLDRYEVLILAVSGGADSMALLTLAAEWACARGGDAPRLIAATVDHGLRRESAAEAAWVAARAAELGLAHRTLVWSGAKPASGIQAAARQARYALARQLLPRDERPGAIVTAHHEDDQGETFLMRLARGSGLDGLAAMHPAPDRERLDFPPVERPFLGVPKARLVATLEARGFSWIEDPSNADERFERARLRKAAPVLAGLGLSNPRIALSARRLQRAVGALDQATAALCHTAVDLHGGAYATADRAAYDASPEELRVRLLGGLLGAYGGRGAPPRLSKVERLMDALARGDFAAQTLGGCIVVRKKARIEIFREPGRAGLLVLALAPGETLLWDGRFWVSAAGSRAESISVRALGDDGAALGAHASREHAMPYLAAITLPSFWRGGTLIAAPRLINIPATPDGARRRAPSPQAESGRAHCNSDKGELTLDFGEGYAARFIFDPSWGYCR